MIGNLFVLLYLYILIKYTFYKANKHKFLNFTDENDAIAKVNAIYKMQGMSP